jgi:hypothetical protein
MIELRPLQRASNGLPADAGDHTVGAPGTGGIAISFGILLASIEAQEEEDGAQVGRESSLVSLDACNPAMLSGLQLVPLL